MKRNHIKAYKEQAVEAEVYSASPHKLVLMAFDGAIQALKSARVHLDNDNIAKKCESIVKAHDIIEQGLRLSLDLETGGDIATNLNWLYQHMIERLLHANMKNDATAIDEVLSLLLDLRDTWATIQVPTNDTVPAREVMNPSTTPQQDLRKQDSMSYGKF